MKNNKGNGLLTALKTVMLARYTEPGPGEDRRDTCPVDQASAEQDLSGPDDWWLLAYTHLMIQTQEFHLRHIIHIVSTENYGVTGNMNR